MSNPTTTDFDSHSTTPARVFTATAASDAALGMEVLPQRTDQTNNTDQYNNGNGNENNENNQATSNTANYISNPQPKDENRTNNNHNHDHDEFLQQNSLLRLCATFEANHDLSSISHDELSKKEKTLWDDIQSWFDSNTSLISRLVVLGETDHNGRNLIHFLLFKFRTIPRDLMELILENGPTNMAQQADSFGWTPLHYAAAAEQVSPEIVGMLSRHHPEGLLATDHRKRSPLHFALGNTKSFEDQERLADASQCIKYLINGVEEQVTRKQDDNGMLPIHYACAYGAPVQILDILRKAYPESLIKQNKQGKTPLHYVMSNPNRASSLELLKYIIQDEIGRQTMAMTDEDDWLPLHYFSDATSFFIPIQERGNLKKCLIQYLDVPNAPQADYFSALRTLPNWLQATAFANPGVLLKDVLNENTAKPLPTMILLLDFYMLIALIFFFQLAVEETISCMYQGIKTSPSQSTNLVIMFITAIYFTFREVFQIYSMIRVGIFFQAWVKDLSNLIDLCCIILTYFWFSKMLQDCDSFDQDQQDIYRSGMAITTGIYWLNFLLYLRATSVDFAVFVGGVIYVMRSLATFLISLLIVLIAFAQMFYNVSQGTNRCLCNDLNLDNMNDFVRNRCLIENDDGSTSSIVDESSTSQNFCNTYQESLLTVYYMMVGQAETEDVTFSVVSTALFCIFMFLAVILLTNMLIAIVTESYVFVKDYNSSEVFWSNRFAFLVEVDPINRLYSQMRKKKKQQQESGGAALNDEDSSNCSRDGQGTGNHSNVSNRQQEQAPSAASNADELDTSSLQSGKSQSHESFLPLSEKWKEQQWTRLVVVFEQDTWDWLDNLELLEMTLRGVLFMIVLIIWICLGIMTAGLLWPHQVRKYLLEQRIGGENSIDGEFINNDNYNDANNDKYINNTSSMASSRNIRRQSSLFVNSSSRPHNHNSRLQEDLIGLNNDMKQLQSQMSASQQELSKLTNEISEIKSILMRFGQP